MTEPTEVSFKPEAPAHPPKPDKSPGVSAPPTAATALPSPEEIGEWIHGAEIPTIGALFAGLPVAKFDVLVLQVRKEELIPQHWQVLSDHTPPDDLEFERLAEVGRLRVRYKDQELSRRRLHHLRFGWRELGGKRPALWTVPDPVRRHAPDHREEAPGGLERLPRGPARRLARPHAAVRPRADRDPVGVPGADAEGHEEVIGAVCPKAYSISRFAYRATSFRFPDLSK
jgi:hypothetical protein